MSCVVENEAMMVTIFAPGSSPLECTNKWGLIDGQSPRGLLTYKIEGEVLYVAIPPPLSLVNLDNCNAVVINSSPKNIQGHSTWGPGIECTRCQVETKQSQVVYYVGLMWSFLLIGHLYFERPCMWHKCS